MIGLMTHGKKNIELINHLWLTNKECHEIRHRIKNLTCQKAPENVIKRWKTMCEIPLSKEEFKLFLKGIQWFGLRKKWNVISRYFLPERTPECLEQLYNLLLDNNILDTDLLHNINSIAEKNKKKKNSKNMNLSQTLNNYLKDHDREINQTVKEISNLQSKSYFYTQEENFEELRISDNYDSGNISNNLRRNTNNSNFSFSNFNTLNKKNKNTMFDFHIKNGDDYAYEKIFID